MISHPEVQGYFAGMHIQWSFNLEKAPWWGGIFERMIQSVKRCLRKTIGMGRLTMDELVNSRPLSYLSAEDMEEPLTPSHLITGRRLLSLQDGPYNRDIDDTIEMDRNSLTKRMVHLSTVMDHFWRRWKKDYLRNSHRHTSNKHPADPVAIGDVVVVQESDQPRGFWKLAKVENLITGSDGLVRGVRIRTQTAGNRPTYLQRPVQLLYPLEVHSLEGTTVPSEQSPDANGNGESERLSSRPRRAAAQNAREIIKVLSED